MWHGNLEIRVVENVQKKVQLISFLDEGSSIAEDSVIDLNSPSETLITEEDGTEDKDELDTRTGEGTSGLVGEGSSLQITTRTLENDEDKDEPLSI